MSLNYRLSYRRRYFVFVSGINKSIAQMRMVQNKHGITLKLLEFSILDIFINRNRKLLYTYLLLRISIIYIYIYLLKTIIYYLLVCIGDNIIYFTGLFEINRLLCV